MQRGGEGVEAVTGPAEGGEGPGTFGVAVQFVFDGVTDGAVALDRGAAHDVRGLGGEHNGTVDSLRGRHVVLDGPGRGEDGRGGELQAERGVGELVLDGLEAADRHPELVPLLDVAAGEVE